ncbi:MAG TPA: glycosyltransferase family 39 protein, partial [Polyangia bacterium]|nr:glycosyltransferase family 39 protein [Polyangia bacterium]
MRLARACALAAAALAVGALAWLIARRIAYPYDLEWLEGATLWHAQRLVDGQPIYVAPSLAFVPHPYTPLYPWLLALIGRVFGVSYVVGRALSVAAFAGALAIGWRFCRRLGASAALATAALAIPCAAYVPTGAWIDLVRVDSVWLLLAAAGTTIAWPRTTGERADDRTNVSATWRSLASALLLVAAFFAKQTAAPLMLAVGLALLATDRRAAIVFAATLALVGLPALWLMQRATGGWFWFYVYRVHQSHPFSLSAASFVPGRLAMLLLPSLP